MDEERELDELLGYMRQQFELLSEDIKMPDSLRADILRQKLELMEKEEETPPKRVLPFPWRPLLSIAACFAIAAGSYAVLRQQDQALSGGVPLTASSAAIGVLMAPSGAPSDGAPAPMEEEAPLEAAPTPAGAEQAPMEAAEFSLEMDEEGAAAQDAGTAEENAQAPQAVLRSAPVPDESQGSRAKLEEGAAADALPLWGYVPMWLPDGMESQELRGDDQYLYLAMAGDGKQVHIVIANTAEGPDGSVIQPTDPVDLERPETYDVRLYPDVKSWADVEGSSVMKWTDATFQVGDVTAERMEARLFAQEGFYALEGTPAAMFRVYYGPVEIKFSVSGLTAEELYRMVVSVETAP